jgi:NADH-quinone oxidoreductase subunit L
MRRMGGLKSALPRTHLTMLVGTLTIAGVFPFAGFFSKDEMLWNAWNHGGPVLWGLGVGGAFLTAFYMFRLYFMTFHGASRVTAEAKHHLHESPNSMVIPLVLLAVLSTVGGFVQVPLLEGGQRFDRFLEPVFADAAGVGSHATAGIGHAAGVAYAAEAAAGAAAHGGGHDPGLELTLMLISLGVALTGIFTAYRFYVADPGLPARLGERAAGLYRMLFNKYWVDEIYDALVVQPIYRGSVRLWERFDAAVIDGAVNGTARLVERGSELLRAVQTGYVQAYALILTLGLVVVLGYLALR